MNGLNYLLQTNLYLLLFIGFYVLVLRNETFFRQNRIFLNTSIFLSFAIPFINSDWFRDLFITQKVREAAIMPTQMMYETIIVGTNEETSSLSISDALFWIYASGATFLLIRFLIRLAFLQSKLKAEKGAAFSFFNTLVVDAEIPKAETIIDHEKVHMRQWHSADIIFIELAAIVNWFNPVMYLYKKEIRHIHEFIADEEAATRMKSKSDYALLLFSNTLGVDPLYLSNNFFNKSLLKRRILMLHKNRSRSTGLWKYGFSAPLFILMLIVSAATVKSEETIQPVAEVILSPLPAETSEEIMSALELNKPASGETVKLKKSTPSNTNPEEELEVHPDFNTLKRHLVRTLKYPPASRENQETGLVIANFRVKGQKVSNVSFVKKLHSDIEADVVKSLTSFASQLDVPDDTYMIAIKYNLAGMTPTADFIPRSIHKNFIGQLTVNAWIGSNSQKTGMPTKPSMAAPQDDALNQFPGGLKAWTEYISKNLRYPKFAKDNSIQGRVVLSFVVDTDGKIEDIKVLRGIGGGADEEAVRVVAQSPKWNPVIKDGVPAKTAYTLPIEFNLSNNSLKNTSQNGAMVPVKPSIEGVLDFSAVDVLPEFEGGIAAWSRYLIANLKYPELAKKDNVSGRVIMSFIVEKDGTIADIKVIRGLGSGLDEEAVRVLKTAPKWKPGLLDGRPVRVAYTMPIFFQLGSK